MRKTLEKLKKGEHVTIVALGDSITANTIHNRGCMNYVSLLDTALKQTYGFACCTVINSGVPGSSYNQAITRLEKDVLRFLPDLVIIALGMNDSSAGEAELPNFRKKAELIIDTIREKCGSDILLMTPNPIIAETGMKWNEDISPGEPSEVWPLKAYADTLVKLASEKKCAVIDNYTQWNSFELPESRGIQHRHSLYQYRLWPRMANSTHPGPLGHLAFYRELAKVFGTPSLLGWEIE